MTPVKRAKAVRRSVTLPFELDQQVHAIAERRRLKANRVLIDLIEQGIEANKQRERNFFELAGRFRSATDPAEVKRLGDQMGQILFGE